MPPLLPHPTASDYSDQISLVDWFCWLRAQEELVFREYEGRPGRLASDSNGERNFVRDYAGREVLELLQNANDAAAKAGVSGCVRIEITSAGLIAANTGAGFSQDGVTSLLLPHTSPKPAEEVQVVGHKGLGFRSLLNWTKTPLISSGNLSLAFSAEVALRKQKILADRSPEIHETIQRQQKILGERIVPLLAFPAFKETGDLTPFLQPVQTALFERMLALRTEGYKTVVGVPFESKTARVAAEQQIKTLQPEILLFSGALAEVIVSIDNSIQTQWRLESKEQDTARIRIGAKEVREWQIKKASGEVVADTTQMESSTRSRFEITLAIPSNHQSQTGFLYSYFPTEVRFPFRLTCHATLDLVSNRQQLQDTPANRYIFAQLAELIASVAETLARTEGPFAGLDLIAGDRTNSDSLEKFGFASQLFRAAQKRKIIPTLAGSLVCSDQARRFIFDDTTWLPKEAFGNVALVNPERNHNDTLGKLNVQLFSEWDDALKSIQFDNLERRATFIAGMVRHGLSNVLAPYRVLVDQNGNLVPPSYRVFLPPSDQHNLRVPRGFDIRFLDSVLARELAQKLGRKDQDALAAILAPFGVTRYSLDTLVSGLAADVNRRVQKKPQHEGLLRGELLRVLFQLFPVTSLVEDRPKFPREALVCVPTLAKTYEDVRELYLSSQYGANGRLLQQLYGSFAPQNLVAAPTNLGLGTDVEVVADFLRWLGVADFPRTKDETFIPSEYYRFIEAKLPFPLDMGGEWIRSPGDLLERKFSGLVTIDRLDEILRESPPAAILAWLALDPRAVGWKTSDTKHGKFGNRGYYQQYVRWYSGPIPSFIRWRISTTAWLPTRNGKILPPSETVAEVVRGLDELFPIPVRPTKQQFEELGVQVNLIRDALDRAGVVPAFSEIDIDRLYEMLISLPELDPKGELAKTVYRALLDHPELPDAESEARARFTVSGAMWARCDNEEKYVPISSLWHVDSEDISATLTRRLNVVALPKRSGSIKVEGIFGVRSLTREVIRQKVTGHQPLAITGPFCDEIEALKPLILALRRRAKEPPQFRNLKILLCGQIEGEMEFQGEQISLEVETWGWVLDDTSATAYVQVDCGEDDPLSSPLLADAVGQIFAAIFRIERGDDFARLVGCRRKDRVSILRRIAGDDDTLGLAELEKAYRESDPSSTSEELHLPQISLKPPEISKPPPFVAPPPPPPVLPSVPPDTPFNVEPLPHTPAQPISVELRITRRIPTGPRTYTGSNHVANGMLCEVKALEFEESDTPKRYPLRVSNVTGWKAPGVDIVSFETSQERDAFLNGDHREELVSRFIEVKGRSTDGAKIDLRNNELVAAQKYRDRYFLYRLFERSDGSYELAVLQNPLADETGVRHYYEINLEAATRTAEYVLTGGVTENTLADALTRPAYPPPNP